MRAAWLFCLAIGVFGCGGCKTSPMARPDGAGLRDAADERPPDSGAIAESADPPCGGTVSSTGHAPDGVSFSADGAFAEAIFTCWGVRIVLSDSRTGSILRLTLLTDADGGVHTFGTGQQSARVSFTTTHAQSFISTAVVTVSSADDPFLAGYPDASTSGSGAYELDAGIAGRLSGSLTMSQDGFSLSAQFATPYCRLSACAH